MADKLFFKNIVELKDILTDQDRDDLLNLGLFYVQGAPTADEQDGALSPEARIALVENDVRFSRLQYRLIKAQLLVRLNHPELYREAADQERRDALAKDTRVMGLVDRVLRKLITRRPDSEEEDLDNWDKESVHQDPR